MERVDRCKKQLHTDICMASFLSYRFDFMKSYAGQDYYKSMDE